MAPLKRPSHNRPTPPHIHPLDNEPQHAQQQLASELIPPNGYAGGLERLEAV